jgi:methionyl-tRNA formyltransferase
VLAGDHETGVAIMKMDVGMDTGPVYRMCTVEIGPHETTGELFERLSLVGGELLEEFLLVFPEVDAPVAQEHDRATHAAKLEKHEGVVDWARPVARVVDHVRGMDPWPAATTMHDDKVLKLYGARVSEREGSGDPGTVVGVDADGLHVCCADGMVCIADIQAPGKRRMPAQAYASGNPMQVGLRLGGTR